MHSRYALRMSDWAQLDAIAAKDDTQVVIGILLDYRDALGILYREMRMMDHYKN